MPAIELKGVTFAYPQTVTPVFRDLTVTMPSGVVSLIGQNGTGKSTFLLLAGGSVLPQAGRVLIDGHDTADLRDERQRQRFVSFIFQNLEFETERNIGDLLQYVYAEGFHEHSNPDFVSELVRVFELDRVLTRRMQEVSKGELQRTILAFSLLYGSKMLLMDEPIFALEPQQKERAMDYLTSYAREHDLPIYYSVHELDLSFKYSDWLLIFYLAQAQAPGRGPMLGPTRETFRRDIIEEAYEVPFSLLKTKEAMYREAMKQTRGHM